MLEQLETKATNLVARLAPWLSPIPTAYLVGKATLIHLSWPLPVAIIAAVIIECLGLSAVNTCLELREYNANKRKSDPTAPFTLAAVLVVSYVLVAIGLTVALDILPVLAVYSPAIFPLLSLAGVTVIALRNDHIRRLNMIEGVKAERQAKRKESRQDIVTETSDNVSNNGKNDSLLDGKRKAKQARLDALMMFYSDNPQAGATEAGKHIGVSRQTVYGYLDELEASKRIVRNGSGIQVM